jgi:hypothetical protein
LFQLDLIWTRINNDQQVPLLYGLALLESNLHDLAIDAAFQAHRI